MIKIFVSVTGEHKIMYEKMITLTEYKTDKN